MYESCNSASLQTAAGTVYWSFLLTRYIIVIQNFDSLISLSVVV